MTVNELEEYFKLLPEDFVLSSGGLAIMLSSLTSFT